MGFVEPVVTVADVLCVGDPHVKKTNISEIVELTLKIKAVAVERKVSAIVLLGDLSDTFEKMHLQAWNTIVWMIKELSSVAPVIYIVGNHDALNNQIFQTEDHFFNAFKFWDGKKYPLLIVDKPTVFKIKDCKFMGIPYVPPGRFEECFEGFEHHTDISAVFCHQEFLGAKMGAIESTHGDKYPLGKPLVVSGHIHERQVMQDNLIYVGSPYPTSFGESGAKTVSLFSFKSFGDEWEEELLDLGLPKKITLKMSCAEAKEWVPDENTKYRINIEDTTEEIAKLKKSKRYKELKAAGKVITKPSDKVVVSRNVDNEGYVDLLQKSIEGESVHVQEIFAEVMKDFVV